MLLSIPAKRNVRVVKLSMMISYSGDFKADVRRVQDLERAGLDLVWVPEAYTFDGVSQMGYLAASTSTIQIGSGILNVFSRTATCIAQTAAGLDYVSDGRFVLGLGASGPQVIEGFHGMRYEKPMPRIRDYINVCRMVWRREPVVYEGAAVEIPLPAGQGTGLGKPLKLINHPLRSDIPIFWASLMGLSVKETAKLADGWLPIFFDPEKFNTVWGDDLQAGLAQRDPALGELQISAGGMVAIGDEYVGDGASAVLDRARPTLALYVGGMGARGRNFYNTICQRYGYVDEAIEIQDLYLDGKKQEAAAAVPLGMLEGTSLVGPEGFVKERIAAFKEAGVTYLEVQPVGADPVQLVERLRTLTG
jgi:F420-dependent oxidoreductase-like protein